MSEEIVKTVFVCNTCGEEFDWKNDAARCHPDISEEKRTMIRYKTRSGAIKTVKKELETA